MDKKQKSISVIMPAYNEEHNLGKAVLHTLKVFRSMNFDFEMIIINDNSLDKTGEISEEIANINEEVKVIHHKKNQGTGAAFQTGINHATKEFVIFVPIDNPMDIEDINTYIPWLDICDIVVGCRVERVGYTWFAYFASFLYNRILVPLLFNIGISDVNWIQVYRRNLFTNGIIKFNATKFFFLVEILIEARRNRLIMVEVPSKMKKRVRGKPTHSNFFVILGALWDMMRYFWKIRREKDN
ncbi:MAG: glycosyltransferase family 2 protein [bacterium]